MVLTNGLRGNPMAPWQAEAATALRCVLAATLGVALILVSPGDVLAQSASPYSEEFTESIEEVFFDETGLSHAKVDAYRKYLKRKNKWMKENVTNYERLVQGKKKKKAKREAATDDSRNAIRYMFDLLDQLETLEDIQEVYVMAGQILAIDFSTRIHHDYIGSIQGIIFATNLAVDWSTDSSTDADKSEREATNLVNVETGEFFTPEELEELTRSGFDISTLDPPGDGLAWRPPASIGEVDIRANYLGGIQPMHEGMPTVFPPLDGTAVVRLQKLRLSQSKPKLDVFWYDEACQAQPKKEQKKCRRKYKLKLGGEIHSDPINNSLGAALGYNVDVSMHTRRIKVYLDDTTWENLQRDWAGYYDQQGSFNFYPLSWMVIQGDESHGFDEGGEYVIFRSGAFEAKPRELSRVGPVAFGHGLGAELREIRGLYMFDVWINNADLKEAENNKLVLRDFEDGKKMYITQQDMGFAYGILLPERINAFPWDAVETSWWSRAFGWSRDRIELNFVSMQRTNLYKVATYADHRWMIRKIGELSREQIEEAVTLGGFPGGIGPLLVEKLIHRRNQLVEYYGLSDEIEPIPVDTQLTTADGTVVDGRLVQNKFLEVSAISYDDHWRDALVPVLRDMWNSIKGAAAAGIGSVESIDLGGFDVADPVQIFPELMIHFGRRMVPNPDAEGEYDQFIVYDTMHIGARVGVGYIGVGQVTLLRQYQIAFPVHHDFEGTNAGNTFLNVLLAWDIRRGKLPERYVLLRQDGFAVGGRVTSPNDFAFATAGVEANLDFIRTWRNVIDRREPDPLIWLDHRNSTRLDANAFVKLLLLRIPFWVVDDDRGWVTGRIHRVDPSKLEAEGERGEQIMADMIQRAKFDDIDAVATADPLTTRSRFVSQSSTLKMIFPSWNRATRSDDVSFTDSEGRVVRREIQSKRVRQMDWSFVDNGETRFAETTGFLQIDDQGKAVGEPVVVVRFRIDDRNAHSDEMNAYYHFLEGLSPAKRYMAKGFNAMDWHETQEPNGVWGRVLMNSEVHLHGQAIDQLLQVDAGGYWERFAANVKMDPKTLAQLRRSLVSGPAKRRMQARHRLRGSSKGRLVLTSRQVLHALERAKTSPTDSARLLDVVHTLSLAAVEKGGHFDAALLSALFGGMDTKSLAKGGQFTIRSKLDTVHFKEMKFPARATMEGRLGPKDPIPQPTYVFEPRDGLDLYHMLDWVRGENYDRMKRY